MGRGRDRGHLPAWLCVVHACTVSRAAMCAPDEARLAYQRCSPPARLLHSRQPGTRARHARLGSRVVGEGHPDRGRSGKPGDHVVHPSRGRDGKRPARFVCFGVIIVLSGHTRASGYPMGGLPGRPCVVYADGVVGWLVLMANEGIFSAPSVVGWQLFALCSVAARDGTCNVRCPSRCLHKSASCSRLFGIGCHIIFSFLPKHTSFLSLYSPQMEGVP